MRAAAVGGGAYLAGKKRQQNQDEAAMDDVDVESSAPAPENGAVSDEGIEELKKLAELKEQGVLTEYEFATQKQKILGT